MCLFYPLNSISCAVISVGLLQTQYVLGAFIITASLWLSSAQWNKKLNTAKPQWELLTLTSQSLENASQ